MDIKRKYIPAQDLDAYKLARELSKIGREVYSEISLYQAFLNLISRGEFDKYHK